MPEKVSWNMRLKIEGGPSFQLGQALETQVYEKFSVTVPAKGAKVDIPIESATLLLVQCSKPTAPQQGQILCKFDDSEASHDLAVVPLIVTGNSLIKLAAKSKISEFTNDSDQDVVIDILICRDLAEPEQ